MATFLKTGIPGFHFSILMTHLYVSQMSSRPPGPIFVSGEHDPRGDPS